MKLIVITSLLLAGCLLNEEPKTRVIHCKMEATDDTDAPADTFAVKDGECRYQTENP